METPPRTRISSSLSVSAHREDGYEVVHGPGLLDRFGDLLRATCGQVAVTVLTDGRVHDLYGERMAASLQRVGLPPQWIVVADGERSKTMATFGFVLGELLRFGMDRRSVLVNFGGGVISDLGGFAASAHLRGIRYANFATSMIAQVDASVGGKVAVNVDAGKNLVGAFHHPCLVAADATLLRTLGDRDFKSGIAEVIKIAILSSPDLFAMLQREQAALIARDADALSRIAAEAVRLKMELVAKDPYEQDLRRVLNLGHTLGHPIETDFAYQDVRHGEAVAVGMAIATIVAHRRGLIARADCIAILDLIECYALLGCVGPLEPTAILQHLRCVRLVRAQELHFVLPTAIGAVTITSDVEDGELVRSFELYEQIVGDRRDGKAWEASL
ncbi:MAG: 3-dehydroquinate synthase [Planctomycetes bacterium]|nr:3-dehydroquinate synthase [Planctomycetota bacterium]